MLKIREPGQTVDHSREAKTYHSLLWPAKNAVSQLSHSIEFNSTDRSKMHVTIDTEEDVKKKGNSGSVHLKTRLRESVGF